MKDTDAMLVTLTVGDLYRIIDDMVSARMAGGAVLPRWLSVADVAEALGVSHSKAALMVKSGRLKAVQDRGRWLVAPDALSLLAAEAEIETLERAA